MKNKIVVLVFLMVLCVVPLSLYSSNGMVVDTLERIEENNLSAETTQVIFTGAGDGRESAGLLTYPPYPAVQAGDLLLCVVMINSATVDMVSVAGFTLLYGPVSQSTTERGWVYYRYAVGSESGSITATRGAGTTGWASRIFGFRNTEPIIGNAIESYSYVNLGTPTVILDSGVTTSFDLSLAVNIVFIGEDNNNPVSFTGETGGDWTQVTPEYEWDSPGDGAIDVQTATMASAGTVNGGSYDMVNADPAGVMGFALLAEVINDAPVIDTSINCVNIDAGDYLYGSKTYTFTLNVSDAQGYANIDYVYFGLFDGSLPCEWEAYYQEDTNTFEEIDADNQIEITADSEAVRDGNTIDITFCIKIEWAHRSFEDGDIIVYVYDSSAEYDYVLGDVNYNVETNLRTWNESEPAQIWFVLPDWCVVGGVAELVFPVSIDETALNWFLILLGMFMVPASTLYLVKGGKDNMSMNKVFYFIVVFLLGWGLIFIGVT